MPIPRAHCLRVRISSGFQGHERDGAYYYWGDGMFGDDGEFFRALRAKKLNHPDVSYRMPPKYRNGTGHLYYDTDEFDNAADAADTFQRNLNACLRGCSRHTGVTLLFRHFLRAGIDVIGAELMYGSHEILLSGLRGNALAYGKTETLSHLALQWHAEPGRRCRLQRALRPLPAALLPPRRDADQYRGGAVVDGKRLCLA